MENERCADRQLSTMKKTEQNPGKAQALCFLLAWCMPCGFVSCHRPGQGFGPSLDGSNDS